MEKAAPAESRRQVRENFSNEIDSWVKDDMPEGVRFTMGSTGPVMQGLGAIESDIYMEGDKIKKIMQDHPEMTLEEIKKVPQILEDPALILKSEGRGKSGANSRLVCFGLTKAQNGQPVMTVMDLRPRENGFVVDDMQKVNSAYTKNNPMAFIQKSDVVYADKKRAIPLLRTTGLTISSQRLLRNGYIGSISYKGSSVNIEGMPFSSVVKMEANDKVQSSMRDSVGRELTEAQQAYFKDSKVRDADGNLLVMYHQTDGTFTVFDTKHKGAGAGDDETPFGIFLKRTSRNIGVRGERQMELYADIRNPLRVRDRTELVSKLRELSADYARLKDESAQIDKEYGAKFEEAKNAFKSFLIQWRKNNPDAPPRAAYDADGFDAAFNAEDNVVKEWTRAKDELALRAKTSITQALRDNGYDGVILENDKGSWGRSTDAYIALDANQVKNTTNKTPTADPDIRYQQRDSDKTGDWDENGNPIFDNTPVRVEEATDFAEVKRRRKAAVEDYGLEKNESMRIESYVSGLAYELNKRMNSGILSEQDQNYADKVRDAFRKFPQYKGTTFRNLSFGSKKAFEEFLLGHKKDDVIKLKAFTSTSKSPNGYKVSGEFIVHMEFRGESNADISETYGLPRQQEVVYMPGIEIRVSDVTTANDGNPFIIVEEVGIRDQRANIGAEKPAGGMESNSENGRNFTGGENEFSDGVRGIERNRYVGNDALSERGKSDPGRSLTDSDVKNQQREPRLSDRDVLRMAADMALRQKNPG